MPLFLAALTIVTASYTAYRRIRFKIWKESRTLLHVLYSKKVNFVILYTPLLRALHWLPVLYRTVFKILLLTFKANKKTRSIRLTFPNLYLWKKQGVGTILDQMTAKFLTFHRASLLPRLVIDLFKWLPLNNGTIFPFLLEVYLQLMLSRRLLKFIYFRRRFPANLSFIFFL